MNRRIFAENALLLMISFFGCILCAAAHSQETLFSGPQPGEALEPFTVIGVFDNAAGKELNFFESGDRKPRVLIFIHEVNRPTIGLVRSLCEYCQKRSQEELFTGIIFLDDDVSAAETQLQRMRHALPKSTPIGIYPDGKEGPGSYGLNRRVALTIIIANQGKVTANYALVQPSLQVDLMKIVKSIHDVIGGDMPSLADLVGEANEMRGRNTEENPPNLRPLLAPLIRLGATEEEVIEAAERIEKAFTEDPAIRREVTRIAKTIVDAGKLSNYGTAKAQEFLKRWSEGKP